MAAPANPDPSPRSNPPSATLTLALTLLPPPRRLGQAALGTAVRTLVRQQQRAASRDGGGEVEAEDEEEEGEEGGGVPSVPLPRLGAEGACAVLPCVLAVFPGEPEAWTRAAAAARAQGAAACPPLSAPGCPETLRVRVRGLAANSSYRVRAFLSAELVPRQVGKG